jgi:hypothetical protein
VATFLTTLSRVDSSNWAIRVREGLWGVGTSNHAKRAATNVAVGDEIVVWQAGSGVMALARATGPARRVRSTAEVPWPDPERYSYLLPITVIAALTEPVSDSFDRMVSRRFGIKTHYLQAGLIELPDAVGAELRTLFPADPAPRRVAGVQLARSSSIPEVLLALYRRSTAGEHDDLVIVGHEDQRGAVAQELAQEPFSSMARGIRFVSTAELAAEVERRLGEGGTP